MFIIRNNSVKHLSDVSLRDLIQDFINQNDVPASSIAEEIKIHKDTFAKFLAGETDLKFMQALRIMKVLGLSIEEFISAYTKDFDNEEESTTSAKLDHIAYVTKNFDVPTLKKVGIIYPRAKMEDYAKCICNFFGFKSIYEYDDASLLPTLFSKSKRKVMEEKEAKMTAFWLKCAISSFNRIDNPNEFNPNLLTQLMKRSAEFTKDTRYGYYRFILVLYQIGVTVLTQQYTTGTKAYGGTLILNDKPCIIVTDMGKQYHKLWISLMHELYHVIYDFEILKSMEYHFSTPEQPDLLVNEEKADQFALNILVHPEIQKNLGKIIEFPFKVKALANELGISEHIIYGVYLESLPNGNQKSIMFAKLNSHLISSDIATKNLLFDPMKRRSLVEAVEKMKERLTQKII